MKSPSSFLLCVILAGTAHATDKSVDYPRDVKPILLNNCSKYHGLDEQEADLGLDHLNLTHKVQGRDFRLTDVDGRVVKRLLA